MIEKAIYTVLDELRIFEDQVKTLRTNDSKLLREILFLAFHPSVNFYYREFPQKYSPNHEIPEGMARSTLEKEFKRMYLFIVRHPKCPPMPDAQRESLFVQFLEGLEHKEAEVIINMMRKDLQVPGLTVQKVLEAFPQLGK